MNAKKMYVKTNLKSSPNVIVGNFFFFFFLNDFLTVVKVLGLIGFCGWIRLLFGHSVDWCWDFVDRATFFFLVRFCSQILDFDCDLFFPSAMCGLLLLLLSLCVCVCICAQINFVFSFILPILSLRKHTNCRCSSITVVIPKLYSSSYSKFLFLLLLLPEVVLTGCDLLFLFVKLFVNFFTFKSSFLLSSSSFLCVCVSSLQPILLLPINFIVCVYISVKFGTLA